MTFPDLMRDVSDLNVFSSGYCILVLLPVHIEENTAITPYQVSGNAELTAR